MKRRALLAAAGAYAALLPFPATPQKAGKVPTLAIVSGHGVQPQPGVVLRSPLQQRLLELGWEEGRNLRLERHWAEGRLERAQAIFADLAARNVDVIYTVGTLGPHVMAELAQRATRSIPIVFNGGGIDPVGQGLVASLARPGGNVTGFSISLGPDFALKRLELMKQIVPGIRRVAALGPAAHFEANIQHWRDGLAMLGLSLFPAPVEKEDEYERAFATALRERADGLLVVNLSLNYVHRSRIIALAARHRLPAEYFFREAVDAGGLAAYGVDVLDLTRGAAGYIDRILRGARPGDLPIALPTKFELSINLKTARALGLAIPQQVLLRADRVIE
ncbi:MAG: ABC transporter substrate-binding protein [Betaproteobacteria bacterium]